MEPEPDPRIPFFPLNNFSTRATFPVRAASSSSCSFPIPTQVCNDGVMKIQQISHKSSSPATPFPHRLVLESIRKDSSHCMLLLLLHGDRGVIDAAEQV